MDKAEYTGLSSNEESKNLQVNGIKMKAKALDLSGMPSSAIPEDIQNNFVRIVGIRFDDGGRVYDFNAGDYKLKINDPVVAEVPEKGLRLGWVSKPPFLVDNSQIELKLKRITREASTEDLENVEKHKDKEKKALQKVKELVGKHNLEMSVQKVEYTLDFKKSVVYFTADIRVDFRDLLKDLLIELKSRVELRQIGVRDETKMKGGIGPCGEELCCSRFLNKFHPVSIKMAKTQNLSLKPTKVSGNCGRLKCCLAYEQSTYEKLAGEAPKRGSKCKKCSSGACGIIKDVNPLKQLVTVQFEDGSIELLKAEEIIELSTKDPSRAHPNESVVADTDKISSDQTTEEITDNVKVD